MMKAIETLVRSTKSRRVGNHAVWFCGVPQEGDLRFLYIMEGATRVFSYHDTFVCHVDDAHKCVFLTDRGWHTSSTARALNEYRRYFVDECGYVLVDVEREHYALNALERDVLSRMIARLDNLEGRDGCAHTFVTDLFEDAIHNGALIFSNRAATEWVAIHFGDLKEVILNGAMDESDVLNPFINTEYFVLLAVLQVADRLVRTSAYLRRGLDGEEECDAIQYTPETIALIRHEWEEVLK